MSKVERDALEESYVERMRLIAEAEGWYDGVKRKKEKE
jgi:hypothetical protein